MESELPLLNGTLYRFAMNEQRNGFVFSSVELADGVANRGERMDEIAFGTGFGCITDIEMGPDGLLYIASLGHGAIFRLLPANGPPLFAQLQDSGPLPYVLASVAGAGIMIHHVRRRARHPT